MKIFGAGSIGNHLAHAARTLGWRVAVCDIDESALTRMRTEIYPARYGSWDDAIQTSVSDVAAKGEFDIICVGTPPDTHIPVALQAIAESPSIVQIEKPLCTPSLDGLDEFLEALTATQSRCLVGYDHIVGSAAAAIEESIALKSIGEILSIDVEFREHWGGIFAAHPWLAGPADSYLGYWQRGGGAGGEHSHGLNLWQHFAQVSGNGRVTEVDGMVQYATAGQAVYDNLFGVHLRTETGLQGRVMQDVVTLPASKRATLVGSSGSLQWVCNYDAEGDAVLHCPHNSESKLYRFPKRRPDDFILELRHVESLLQDPSRPSGMTVERGSDTMLVVAAAHLSEREGSRVAIDWNKGHSMEALETL